MKRFLAFVALFASCLMTSQANADMIITGVIDGDLFGGNPKGLVFTVTSDIADLTQWGVGVANNGGGSDGEEFTFAPGTATAGDIIVVAGNTDSTDFFQNCFTNLTVFQDGGFAVNGDDPFELYMGGSVIDTYGDVALDGTGTPWEYTDGYAVRTGGSAGAFNLANYSINQGAFDGMTEQQQKDIMTAQFGFVQNNVPEPGSTVLLGLLVLGMVSRRRR